MHKYFSRFAVHMAHAPMGPIVIGPNLRIELRSEAMKIDFLISTCANIKFNTIGIKFEMQELVWKT